MNDLAKLVNTQAQLERMEAEAKAKMAPAGALGLHPLVDQRRLEYLIPDGAFKYAAMFDRIIVAQLPEQAGETFIKGGKIVMSARERDRKTKEAPCGVIISAGLGALDQLASNGCGLGHLVYFIRNAPYRFEVDSVCNISINVMLMRAGDIVASVDLHDTLVAGQAKIEVVETAEKDATGREFIARQHVFTDPQGRTWTPTAPWISDDT